MMRKRLDLEQSRVHLALALQVVRNDRWVLGGVRDGRLRVLAQSGFGTADVPPAAAAASAGSATGPASGGGSFGVRTIYQELSHMARRCLFERHPLAVSTVVAARFGDEAEWEMEWPSIVYAPVGLPETRPLGIMIVGSRSEHWYTQEEIDYVAALAVTMTGPVAAACGPLGRLNSRQRQVALLLAENFSDDEIAIAMHASSDDVARIVDQVLRRLDLRSRHEVRDLIPGLHIPPGRPRLV